MANLFCGYACVVYAMRGEYETAAPFIGFAIVLDMLDGRIARLTGTASDFGVQFDSLADVISFGIAPAMLSFAWGLAAARPARLGGRLPLRDGGRDASRALQHPESRRAATSATSSACRVPRRRRSRHRPCSSIRRASDYRAALPALAMVLVPAVLMVSTIRFRSFKTIDLQIRRPYTVLLLIAAGSCSSRPIRGSCSSRCRTPTSRRPSSGWRSPVPPSRRARTRRRIVGRAPSATDRPRDTRESGEL